MHTGGIMGVRAAPITHRRIPFRGKGREGEGGAFVYIRGGLIVLQCDSFYKHNHVVTSCEPRT